MEKTKCLISIYHFQDFILFPQLHPEIFQLVDHFGTISCRPVKKFMKNTFWQTIQNGLQKFENFYPYDLTLARHPKMIFLLQMGMKTAADPNKITLKIWGPKFV